MPFPRLCWCLPYFLIVLLSPPVLSAANQAPQSDPVAIALAAQSMSALTNGIALSDVSLTATATWNSGGDPETGTATLYAKGLDNSRADLVLASGTRTQIRSASNRFVQGASIGVDGVQQLTPPHNCWAGANWFFPALSAMAFMSDPSVVLAYAGQETRSGRSVYHIRATRWPQGVDASLGAFVSQWSTTELYLDASSFYPFAMTFVTHSDSDASTNIGIEIRYFSYQPLNGVLIPMHVQKLVSGTLVLDLAVTGAALNSGLPDNLFAIQQ